MRRFRIKYSETFYQDISEIVNHIFDKSKSRSIALGFYDKAIATIKRRSFGADSYESFIPYSGGPNYYRIYFGKYIIYCVIDGEEMDIRHMLWSGSETRSRTEL